MVEGMDAITPGPPEYVKRLIDEPGLRALGYDVTVGLGANGRGVSVTLRHPLRGNGDWGWVSLDLEPAPA